ncbi:bifunctional non-homologous end joining protein LigD [Sinorhizobium fredii]
MKMLPEVLLYGADVSGRPNAASRRSLCRNLVDKPPKGPDWTFEVKWDGYRLAVHVEPGEVRAITRGGYDWTNKFSAIVAEARELGRASMILDGEAVVLDDQGRSDFGLLQRAVGKKPSLHDAGEIIFYAFDLLYLDGHDLRNLPLSERRRFLEPIVAGRTGAVRFSEEVNADGAEFFRVACEHGLEGIIAKRRDKPYHSGRRQEWLKIKCARRDTSVIVGYEPSTCAGAMGRLLLAARKGERLVYVGGRHGLEQSGVDDASRTAQCDFRRQPGGGVETQRSGLRAAIAGR